MEKTIEAIAKNYLGVETLSTRNNDSLDFTEVSAWGVKDALNAAYRAGLEDQAVVLNSDQPIIFGNRPEAVIRSLGEQGFTDLGISQVMRSCGIEMKLTDIGQILHNNDDIAPAELSKEQSNAMQYRATLYQGYMK
ncbi:MAG: hypothetical protein CML13_06840 [Puniceicoccaceae bacterium]|nr:hypothetical protein [Puniceicoccaceae bacterium]|tara:strand:+ start:20094 stop:20501 length:408 start_codon:yes stop_codon:yes gene_type:complete